MKGLDKGPKIELSKLKPGNLKVPGAVRELWNDLRGQRLLPVVAILIVGLVAIPVVLGGSSKPKPEVAANPPAVAPGEATASDLVVSKFAPGLRDYRLRYGRRKATSPFDIPNQKAKGGSGGGKTATPSPVLTESTEPSGGSEAGSGEGTEPPIEETTPTEPSEENHGPTAKEEAEKEAAETTIDVRVTAIHLDGTTSEDVRRNVEQQKPLPSLTVPALEYAGPTPDGKSATMAVSAEVTDLLGKANCIERHERCELLALKLGQPETLVFGPRGLTYRLELIRIGTHTLKTEGSTAKGEPPAGNGGGTQKSPSETEGSEGKLERLSRNTIAIGN